MNLKALPLLAVFFTLLHCARAQTWPSTAALAPGGVINGLSSSYDYLTGDYHMAWHNEADGSVQYRRLTPAGVVVAGVTGAVDTTDAAAPYAFTSVTFDDQSRPVVAYTRKASNTPSIWVARWTGSAWSRSQVVSGVLCTGLSLDLYQKQAVNWRLAYLHYTQPALRIASAGGGDIQVVSVEADRDRTGFALRYSANSGSLVWRDPEAGALLYGNLTDNGGGVTAVGSVQTAATGDCGVQVMWAARPPDGWPHFLHRDLTTGELWLTRRLPDFSWTTETALRPTFPAAVLAHPHLWFDAQGNPVAACTDSAGDRIRFAVRLAGAWQGDVITRNAALLRKPLFLTGDGGGFRVFGVSTPAATPSIEQLFNWGPIDDFSDADGDAVPLRLESAMVMLPAQADRQKLPQPVLMTIGGQRRLAVTVRHQTGGTVLGTYGYEAGGYRLLVEVSRDLQTWEYGSTRTGMTDAFVFQGVRYATYYITEATGTPGAPRYLRVRVERL